jgi:Fe-S cluster assembly ATP-binding protein
MNKLEIQNITVEADGKTVVHGATLSLEEGAVSVLMGPNGSGKSTLVNAVMGHPSYTVTGGKLLLDGKDILKLPTEKKAQAGLFLSLQHIPKVGGTTLATFLHKAYLATHDSDMSVLEFYAGMRGTADELGIDSALLDRPLTDGLSGGEKKLSEVLQLAALKPKFAILDEIDSGVDVDALRKVFKAINELRKKGTSFLIISHHPALLDHISPDHVHVMSTGKLVRSDGKELAEEILKKGFCVVANCPVKEDCGGSCS